MKANELKDRLYWDKVTTNYHMKAFQSDGTTEIFSLKNISEFEEPPSIKEGEFSTIKILG